MNELERLELLMIERIQLRENLKSLLSLDSCKVLSNEEREDDARLSKED